MGLPPLPRDGADRMVALTLRAELAAAAVALRQGGITPPEQPGRLTVPAAAACGLALSFAG